MSVENKDFSALFQIMPAWKQMFIKNSLLFLYETMIKEKMLCGNYYDINVIKATFEKLCALCDMEEVKKNRGISENRELFDERIKHAGSTDPWLNNVHSARILNIAGVSE